MPGPPLNGRLTERGARFPETARTASDDRLYALPGGPPDRPGLLAVPKAGTRRGGPIALDFWAMSTARLGDFLAAIPAPLELGTLRLSDGQAVTGFQVNTEGAEDITALGVWRAYLDRLSAAVLVPS